MSKDKQILGLCKLGSYIKETLNKEFDYENVENQELQSVLRKSEIDNPWFTIENQRYALNQWAELLTKATIEKWLENYNFSDSGKKVGLILAGNIPLVGLHDVISVVLSGNVPVIKLSSKDKVMIPYLLKKWNEFAEESVPYEIVEKLVDFDAVNATGSNNTARYLEYYFKNHLSIIRKNRTSVAVLDGSESDEELQLLANDIFRYYGLGCRNVTRLWIPNDMKLDRLFENFMDFQNVINHNKYANNYEYNRAIYLLNQEKFWDNNFVLIKEDEKLFSPLSVINFSRYDNIEDVKSFIEANENDIQCVVAKKEIGIDGAVGIGEAQNPSLDTYADNVDTMRFLEVI